MEGLAGAVFTGSISSATVLLVALALLVRLRTARIIDLGLAALGAYGASVFFELRESGDLVLPILGLPERVHLLDRPTIATALVVASVPSVLVAALVQRVLLEPLRDRPPVNSLAASLGMFLYFQQLTQLRFPPTSAGVRIRRPVLDQERIRIGTFSFGRDGLVLLGLAIVTAVALHLVFSRSRFGRISDAANSNTLGAVSVAVRPARVATAGSMVATVIVTVALILAEPVVGTGPGASLLVVPALAALLLGHQRSFPVTALGAVAIGVGQSLVLTLLSGERSGWLPSWIPTSGVATLVPTAVIVGIAMTRREPTKRADATAASFQPVSRRPGRVPYEILAVLVVSMAVVLGGGVATSRALAVSATAAVLYLSVVVCVGYSGQLSLLPVTTAGACALVFARVFAETGKFAVAVVAGLSVALVLGFLAATVVSRLAGVTVALVTLAMAVTIQELLLDSSALLVGPDVDASAARPRRVLGVPIGSASLEGISQARLFALLCVGVVVVCLLVVRTLRRSPLGARIVADKSNPVKAAAFGIDPTLSRWSAVVAASLLAGLSGILTAMALDRPTAASFMVIGSIVAIALTTLGGTGLIAGALLAAVATPDGLLTALVGGATAPTSEASFYISALSGVALMATLAASPDGVAGTVEKRLRQIRRPRHLIGARGDRSPVAAAALNIESVTVRIGGRVLLDKVSLLVRPGEVVGIVGRNGAGKTTLLDVCSGLVPLNSGEISLGQERLDTLRPHQRARRGMARIFQAKSSFESLSALEVAQVSGIDLASAQIEGLDPAAVMDSLDLWESLVVDLGVHAAMGPSVWLLDEPASGLDSDEKEWLVGFVARVADAGAAVLLADHDTDFVEAVSDRVFTLDHGRLLAGRANGGPALSGPSTLVPRGWSDPADELSHSRAREEQLVSGDLPVAAGDLVVVEHAGIVGNDVWGELRSLFGPAGRVLGTDLSAESPPWRRAAGTAGRNHLVAGLSSRGLALLPSGFGLFAEMNVEENLCVAQGARRMSSDTWCWLEQNFPELICLRSSPAGVLSGGEQKLLLIARAMIRKPRLVVASAPFRGLHPDARQRMEELLGAFPDSGGAVVLTVGEPDRRDQGLVRSALDVR